MTARAAEHGGPGTSSDRLQRLLALVPYVISRKVVGLAETAAAFGVSERELTDDLNMLWCVELRTPDPYCPIDLSYEGGEIVISQAEPVDRPLRLGVDEASALLVALRMLAVLLLALLFARPFRDEAFRRGLQEEMVLLIDRSASMQARQGPGETAFSRALAGVQAQRNGQAAARPKPRGRGSILDAYEPLLKELPL